MTKKNDDIVFVDEYVAMPRLQLVALLQVKAGRILTEKEIARAIKFLGFKEKPGTGWVQRGVCTDWLLNSWASKG